MTMSKLAFQALLAGLLALAATLGVAQAPPAQPTQAEAMALLREMAATQDFQAWMKKRSSDFTPPLAAAVEDLSQRAAEAGSLDTARLAAILASMMYRQLDLPQPELRNALMVAQVGFMKAETLAEYDSLRGSLTGMKERALALHLSAEAFQAAVALADAAWFANETPEAKQNRRDSLLPTLADLRQAYTLMPAQPSRLWTEKLVSLTGKVADESQQRITADYDQTQSALKALTPLIEAHIPADFAYTFAQAGDARKTVATARALAALSYRFGNTAMAGARLSLASSRAAKLGDPELEIGLLVARYDGESATAATPEALRELRNSAWQRAQALRKGYRSPAGRIWAAQRSDALFGDLLQSELSDRGASADDQFQRVESLKARMLLDRLAAPATMELRSQDALALGHQALAFAKSDRLKKDMYLEEARLVSRLAGLDGFASEKRLAALGKLEQQYRATQPAAGYAAVADTVPLATLQQLLEPDEALVEFVIPHHATHPAQHLWAMLVTRDQLRLTHVSLDKVLGVAPMTGTMTIGDEAPLDSSRLGELIIDTRMKLRMGDDKTARERLTDLHELLLATLLKQGFDPAAYKRLIVVPHGVLHAVPFPALVDKQGRYLIAKTEVVVAPSASVWRHLAARRTALEPALVLANPQLASRGVADLPFAAQEGRAIAGATGSLVNLYVGADATLARLRAGAATAGVIHLATHGEFPDESAAAAHAVWLADEGKQGRALTADDARQLNLSKTRLVVLSVCNGGLYRIGPSDEPYGLVPAFLQAGAANVLGTLWPLNDQAGRDFMAQYYKHLGRYGVAGALRQASLAFIGEEQYLRNWAGFVLVGAGR